MGARAWGVCSRQDRSSIFVEEGQPRSVMQQQQPQVERRTEEATLLFGRVGRYPGFAPALAWHAPNRI
jgi:hypothetical protein